MSRPGRSSIADTGAPRRGRRAAATVAGAALAALALPAGAQAAAVGSGAAGAEVRDGLSSLRQAASGTVRATGPTAAGAPTILDAAVPLRSSSAAGSGAEVVDRFAGALGVAGQDVGLALAERKPDRGGERLVYAQRQGGVPVEDGRLTVLVDGAGDTTRTIANGLVRGEAATTTPTVGAATARVAALRSGERVTRQPALRIAASRPGATPRLAWVLETAPSDPADPAGWRVAVDATDGTVLRRLTTTYDAKDRVVRDANRLPTTGSVVRREGAAASGVADADAAYEGTGATYDYYEDVHGRDSYDDAGASLVSVVRYRQNPLSAYQNAFWSDQTQRMTYGEGMATLDVTAHELTHAVTSRSAELVYQGQSGALNESFSDVFATAVDDDDWDIGEGSAVGVIRSMSDPNRYGQPATLAEYDTTCEDNQGVHINSGIPNRAYYLAVQGAGRAAASAAFYRALTVYLGPNSGFTQARAATIQAAGDLYGAGSAQATEIGEAWDGVGVDGQTEPPAPSC